MRYCILALGILGGVFFKAARAATTFMYQFTVADSTGSAAYTGGDIEYHCFDITNGVKSYVRGTYSSYGYFEGQVDANNPYAFYVDWYDVTSGNLLPTSGAAYLNYSSSWDEVTGPYWATGSSDFLDSFGEWHSVNGAFVTDDTTSTGETTILTNCFFPGASNAIARDDIAALGDSVVAITGASDDGTNTFCQMPAGTPGGAWLGTYKYIYSADEGGGTEYGNLGTNPFAFWVKSGMGVVGNWHADTGDYAGQYGTSVYMVSASATKTTIVGFFCYIDAATLERTSCGTEYYEVSEVNQNIDNCPYDYRKDSSLDPLYTFAATGSSLSDTNNSGGNKVAVALAIFFGCLSGVLMLVVLWQQRQIRATAATSAPAKTGAAAAEYGTSNTTLRPWGAAV